jgi:chromosome segregation ATPase
MATVPRVFLVLVVILAGLAEQSDGTRMRANPIRRVITMLQMMMKKSEDQATSEEQLFDKFMCSCKKTQDALMGSIKSCKEKIPQLEASVEELNARIGTAEQDFKQAKKDRADAEKSLQEAKVMRTGEAREYAKDSTEAKANIKSMAGAVTALKSGISQDEFLQTGAASMLQGLIATGRPGKGYDRDALGAFLQEGDQTEDTPEIIGILEQMKEDMEKDLKGMDATEVAAIASFEALNSAKAKQITAANQAIEELGSRIAASKVELVNTKTDLKDTNERLDSDSESYGASKLSCQKRDQEYGILKKQFADEKVALADTIKILADDQAMDVFKKTNAVEKDAPTFLQLGSSSRHRQKQALRLLQETSEQHPDQPALQQLAKHVASVARQGGHSKKGFEKIMGLVDKMIALLGKEANDDKIKKEMCEVDLARNDDTKATLENNIKSKSAEVANMKDNLGIVVKDMAKIKSDMAELDATVKEATLQRQAENAAFTQMLSETNQAVGILEVAKTRLKEFYGGAFIQQRVDASEEAPSFLQEGDSEGSTDEFGFLSGAVEAKSSKHKHKKKPQTQGAKAVLTMVATIQQDLTAEFQTAKKEEGEAQADYESLLADAKKKREVTARAMTEKEGAKAALQENKKKGKDRIQALKEELAETIDVIADLHKDCDWLIKNFEERVKLRAAEVESLRKAKSALAGAS